VDDIVVEPIHVIILLFQVASKAYIAFDITVEVNSDTQWCALCTLTENG
jgi:hypothetical protein